MILKAINLALASAVCVLDMVCFSQERLLGNKRLSWMWFTCGVLYFAVVIMRIIEFGTL